MKGCVSPSMALGWCDGCLCPIMGRDHWSITQFASKTVRKLSAFLETSVVLFRVAKIFGACGSKNGSGVSQSYHKSVNASATTGEEQGHLLLGKLQLI